MATPSPVVELPPRKTKPTSRVVFTQGGKGGVGKTAFSTLLVEWYVSKNVPLSLIDMDSENKSRGSLGHFFPEARKANVQRARGLDDFVDVLDSGSPIVVADMGAGAGEVAHRWFDSMHEQAQENGVAFTAIGLVTPDPASVSSILAWGKFLQDRVEYLIVKNSISEPADFSCWENDGEAEAFRRVGRPKVISMEYRIPEIEHEAREHGLTLRDVAERKTDVPALKLTASVWRAQAYRREFVRRIGSGEGPAAAVTTTATPIGMASLADQLTNTQDRETYSALMCYLNRLPPGDEFRQLAELLGLLSLVGQRIPGAISDFLTELRMQTSSTAEHHRKLEAQLTSLPHEIAAGVDISSLAKAMSESFRQQLSSTGLHDTATLLKAAVITLKSLSVDVTSALLPVASTLRSETAKLLSASREVGECNKRLIERQTVNWWVWQVAVVIAAFSLGTLYGGFVEKRSLGDGLSNINTRLQELHVPAQPTLANPIKP